MLSTQDLAKIYPSLKKLALARLPRTRIPVIRQLTSTDCGAAALAMVLGYHGKHTPLDEVREAIGIGRSGATAASILRVAQVYGLRGRGVSADIESLDEIPPGSILHWEFRHYVVFERRKGDNIHIVDPAVGRRVVPIAVFRRSFTGVALLFEPTHNFDKQPKEKKGISGLFFLVLERKDLIARIIATSLLVQFLSLAMPLLTGVMIDRVVPRKDYSLLGVLAIGFCVFQVFNSLAAYVQTHLNMHLRTQLEVRFTLRFLDHLMALPYSFFQQRSYGDLMVRLGSNNSVRNILTSTVFSAFMDGIMASVYLVLLMFVSSPLTLLVMTLAAARLGLMAIIRWRQRQLVSESMENQALSQSYQVEMLSGMETLKAMGLEQQAARNWSNVFVDGLNISIKQGRLGANFGILTSVLGLLSTLVTNFYGTYLVLNGTWTLGTMMAFNAVAGGFLAPLNSLVSSALQLQMLEVYMERLNDVLQAPPEQDATSSARMVALRGEISIENLSFRYNAQDQLVLQEIDLRFGIGSRIALVGRSGSGKSTLARLLAGLYDPTTGRICYDGNDLKTLNRRAVRSQLGFVAQDAQLFGGSIRRNIALADPEMSLDGVVRAAKMACIHDEIIAMPMGYETPLSDRGMSLSGGQRQRLSIARALASAPRILILDEATSHLDAVTESRVIKALGTLRCTTIVIAHRLSTIRDADQILILEGGKMIEQGRHDDLIRKSQAYRDLLGTQSPVGSRASSESVG